MYDCWRATSIAPAYFTSLIVLGVFFALNLFLAILLRPFDGNNAITSKRIYPEGKQEPRERHPWLRRVKFAGALRWIQQNLLSRISCWRYYEFVLKKRVWVQNRCHKFVANKKFDLCLTFVIILSSVTLALDNPLRDSRSRMAIALLSLNYLFTSVFLVEFLIKVIADGFIRYFQDRWNLIDFTAVVASILELSNVKGSKTLRVLRAFRVLRPLKMINRFPEVKVVVDALLLSLPSVVDVGKCIFN